MLSFDDFSIKKKHKEKTVRTIKISLEVIRILIQFLPVLTAAGQKAPGVWAHPLNASKIPEQIHAPL